MDLNGIRSRLARISATVVRSGDGDPVSVRMYNGLSRVDAVAALWADELLAASHAAHQPDPSRPLGFLRLFDTTTWPCMIRQNLWSHQRETSFALDFRGWTREEVLAYEADSAFGGCTGASERALIAGMGEKIAALEARAEEVWRTDEELMRFLATRGEPC